jgi:RNA polymerase sigma factor (TIGR02999 family)
MNHEYLDGPLGLHPSSRTERIGWTFLGPGLIIEQLWIHPMCSSSTDSHGPTRNGGDSRVDLTTTLYGKLRKLAAARMAGQYGPQTLQATALVHEAWIRLGGDEQPHWSNQAHFFGAVAEAMRNILIDRAQRRQRIRHGGGLQRVDLETWNWERLDSSEVAAYDEALIAMHEALGKFAVGDPQTAKLVKLHFFTGLTIREVAEALGISERTAKRRLAYARAWLGLEVRRGLAA